MRQHAVRGAQLLAATLRAMLRSDCQFYLENDVVRLRFGGEILSHLFSTAASSVTRYLSTAAHQAVRHK